MVNTLFWVSWLVYGGDVGRLADPDYRTREAAHKRLEAAGWCATPAVSLGLRSPEPERAERCGRLLNRVPDPAGLAARWWLDGTDGDAAALAERCPGVAERVCRLIDARRSWETSDSWDWVCRTPYRTTSRGGDFALVVSRDRLRRQTAAFWSGVVAGSFASAIPR